MMTNMMLCFRLSATALVASAFVVESPSFAHRSSVLGSSPTQFRMMSDFWENLFGFSSGPGLNDKFPNLIGSTQDTDSDGDFKLYDYVGDDSWSLIFMHPGDFTPVCTTELGQAAGLQDEFAKRNTKLVGFSCNDQSSHKSWIEDIANVTGNLVDFPLFCDPNRDYAYKMGILDETNKDAKGLPLTVRSIYILKPDKTIALMMTYPASTGRNFDEILRVLDSVQLTASNSVATPVDWKKGDDVIVNFPLSNADADEKFGKDGYRVVAVPSEEGKELAKNYLRYTADPSADMSDKQKKNIFKRLKRVLTSMFKKE